MRPVKILLTALLVVNATGVNAQSKNCFVLGSTQSFIRNLHGIPNSIYKSSETKETWYYGRSSITFKDRLVTEYDNYGKNLKICKEVIAVSSPKEKERSGYLQPALSKSKATKADTENWILEKLNANVPPNIEIEGYYSTVTYQQYSGRTIRNTGFDIQDGNLLVYMDVVEQGRNLKESYLIPIHKLHRIHAEDGKIVFTTKSLDVYKKLGKLSSKEASFAVKFNFDAEPDIKARLVSAFSHLQKVTKPGKTKEVF